jgi:DNA-binding transcriptional regulator YiaG
MSGRQIADILSRLGWTHTHLAVHFGIAENTVRRWIRDNDPPKQIYLRALWELKQRADAESGKAAKNG